MSHQAAEPHVVLKGGIEGDRKHIDTDTLVVTAVHRVTSCWMRWPEGDPEGGGGVRRVVYFSSTTIIGRTPHKAHTHIKRTYTNKNSLIIHT